MLEPYSSVSIVDRTIGLGTTPTDTGYSVLVPVFTPTGPEGVRKITSFSEFSNLYLGGRDVKNSDHESIHHAKLLLESTPIQALRIGSESKYFSAISDLGLNYIVNEDGSLMQGKSLTISPKLITEQDSYIGIDKDYLAYTGTPPEDYTNENKVPDGDLFLILIQ